MRRKPQPVVAQMSRREMMQIVGGATMALSLGPLQASESQSPLFARPIPSTGENLPIVGLGTWQSFDVGESEAVRAPLREVLATLARSGGRVVDSSPMYNRSEGVVGDLAGELGAREQLFYATKVWTSGKERGIEQMERSLARWGGESIDLMQVHNLIDVDVHMETLAEWKAEGRIRYTGMTHYLSSEHEAVEEAIRKHRPDFVQINYSIDDRAAADRLLPTAAELGVAVLINRPFGAGGLFNRVRGRLLPDWAPEIGCMTWAQFFLKFILGHPAVTCVIPGTSKVQHLEDNLAAAATPPPDEETAARMAEYFDQL